MDWSSFKAAPFDIFNSVRVTNFNCGPIYILKTPVHAFNVVKDSNVYS